MGQVGKYMCFDVTSSTLLKKSEGVFVYIIQREMQSQNSVSVTNFLSSIFKPQQRMFLGRENERSIKVNRNGIKSIRDENKLKGKNITIT